MKEQRRYVSYDTRFRQSGLDVLNMILLTEIENLCKLPGGCYASDKQLGELIMIGRKNTNERVKYLESLKLIECHTRFEKGKRLRFIKFLTDKVELPLGNTNQSIRKRKGKSPQGNLSQSPLGNSGSSPQGNNNKLIKEVKKKESTELTDTGSIYSGPIYTGNTGPNGKEFVDISSNSEIVEGFNDSYSKYNDIQSSTGFDNTSTNISSGTNSINRLLSNDQDRNASSTRLKEFKNFSISKIYDQLDPGQQMLLMSLPMVERLQRLAEFQKKKSKDQDQPINSNKNKI
ncbi:MAG TPA: hypothetical protein PLL94_09005 [Bacteroidales bacterium]|jgi:hypothetical protein|nr:MAG: hypothetical protein BWX96_02412 [Bacteroidetes bacterium ADurb.Bin145]HQK68273.1 hypothetical protein [Bacteroidales bacterium]